MSASSIEILQFASSRFRLQRQAGVAASPFAAGRQSITLKMVEGGCRLAALIS